MHQNERSPAARAMRRGPFEMSAGGDDFETKCPAQKLQARQPPLKRRWPRPTPALVGHAEAIHQLGAFPLAHLLAELEGADPTERVRVYAALAPLADFVNLGTAPVRERAS
jgi:hypothetical protein